MGPKKEKQEKSRYQTKLKVFCDIIACSQEKTNWF